MGNGRITYSLLQWKGNKHYVFVVCVCIFCYAECNAHVPCYIVFRGLLGSTIYFQIISLTAQFSENKIVNITGVF